MPIFYFLHGHCLPNSLAVVHSSTCLADAMGRRCVQRSSDDHTAQRQLFAFRHATSTPPSRRKPRQRVSSLDNTPNTTTNTHPRRHAKVRLTLMEEPRSPSSPAAGDIGAATSNPIASPVHDDLDFDAGDIGAGMQDLVLDSDSAGDIGETEMHEAGGHESLDLSSGARDHEGFADVNLDDDDAGDIGGARSPSPPPVPVSKTNGQDQDIPSTAAAPEPARSPVASSPRLSISPAPEESLLARRSQTMTPLRVVPPIVTTTPDAVKEVLYSPDAPLFRSTSRTATTSERPTSVHSMRSALSGGSLASPRVVTSPLFRTVEIPHATATDDEEGSPDESAPFESIPIDEQDAPPPVPILPALHTRSDSRHSLKLGHSKRDSWGGFGIDAHGQPVAHGVLPVHPPPTNGSATAPAGGGVTSPARVPSPASGSSTPRRHAPPAHPHPFPIPTTSPSAHTIGLPSSAPVSSSSTPHPTQALGVKGTSAFEKFISRTRPSHLPPKDKTEDAEHLHEWEHMMAKSREHETERRKLAEAKAHERERHVVAVTPKWEALLDEFNAVKIRETPALRHFWFEGVPPQLRGKAWSLAVGNALAMHKDAYRTYLRRAERALELGRFPQDILVQLEKDLDETLVPLHVFHRGSPMRDDLKQLVCAWVVYRSDEGRGYAPFITRVAAMFILVAPPPVAFITLCNFLARSCLHAFYTDTTDEIDAYYRVFENLQADMFPRIFANCKNLGLRLPESYFRSVLVEQVPFDAACRLFDQIMLDGDGYIFRAALAIFGFLEPRLYYPDHEEILSVLEGRNKATQAISDRERERARLRGEQYDMALDGKLSVFGLHEEPLFEWLEHDGWRESGFQRLVTRELPD